MGAGDGGGRQYEWQKEMARSASAKEGGTWRSRSSLYAQTVQRPTTSLPSAGGLTPAERRVSAAMSSVGSSKSALSLSGSRAQNVLVLDNGYNSDRLEF